VSFSVGWNRSNTELAQYAPVGSTIRCVRHMTTSPENGLVVLVYGCSECNWIYRPLTPEEASQISWYAQINFEKHDCSHHQSGTPVRKKPA
jgi:rubredoxin